MSKGQNQLFEAALAAKKAAMSGPKVERPVDEDLVVARDIAPTIESDVVAGPITQKNTTPLPKAPKRVVAPQQAFAAPIEAPVNQVVEGHTEVAPAPRRLPSTIDLSKTVLPDVLRTMFGKVNVGQDRILVEDIFKRVCNPSLEPINRCIERIAREHNVDVYVEFASRDGRYRVMAK